MAGARPSASSLVEPLQVLRGQPVQAVPADSGDDPVADLRGVGAVDGGPADPPGGHGGQPGFHPLAHSQIAGFGDAAGVALPFQLLDLAGDLGLAAALAVAPVGRAVVFGADRDPAVPPAIGAEVDRGPAVGLTGRHHATLSLTGAAASSSSWRTNARRASAVTNRQAPSLTDCNGPDLMSPNSAVRPRPRTRAASAGRYSSHLRRPVRDHRRLPRPGNDLALPASSAANPPHSSFYGAQRRRPPDRPATCPCGPRHRPRFRPRGGRPRRSRECRARATRQAARLIGLGDTVGETRHDHLDSTTLADSGPIRTRVKHPREALVRPPPAGTGRRWPRR